MTDERLASIAGTKRVIHHSLEDPIGSVSLLLQAAIGLPQRVRDFRLGGVGKRRARQSQVMNLGNTKERSGMARALLRLELFRVALRAACRADERSRVGEGRVVVGVRTSLFEGRQRLGHRPFLKKRAASQPGSLGVRRVGQDCLQLVSCFGGPSGGKQGREPGSWE